MYLIAYCHQRMFETDDRLYVARDVLLSENGLLGHFLPQHAVIENGKLVWKHHDEGREMAPLIDWRINDEAW